jgi:hypothetical protein
MGLTWRCPASNQACLLHRVEEVGTTVDFFMPSVHSLPQALHVLQAQVR